MLDVVLRYGVLTDQTITIDPDTRQLLRNERIPIQRSIQVPAPAIQGFVEALLAASDYVLTIERDTAPRLVQVHSLQTPTRNVIRSKALYIDAPDLAMLREHPAVLFAVRVQLPSTDARMFANSMRTVITAR